MHILLLHVDTVLNYLLHFLKTSNKELSFIPSVKIPWKGIYLGIHTFEITQYCRHYSNASRRWTRVKTNRKILTKLESEHQGQFLRTGGSPVLCTTFNLLRFVYCMSWVPANGLWSWAACSSEALYLLGAWTKCNGNNLFGRNLSDRVEKSEKCLGI